MICSTLLPSGWGWWWGWGREVEGGGAEGNWTDLNWPQLGAAWGQLPAPLFCWEVSQPLPSVTGSDKDMRGPRDLRGLPQRSAGCCSKPCPDFGGRGPVTLSS